MEILKRVLLRESAAQILTARFIRRWTPASSAGTRFRTCVAFTLVKRTSRVAVLATAFVVTLAVALVIVLAATGSWFLFILFWPACGGFCRGFRRVGDFIYRFETVYLFSLYRFANESLYISQQFEFVSAHQ